MSKEDFHIRLKNLRDSLGVESKREMAKMLGLSEQFYGMLESNNRKPSQKVLNKLVELSGLPEEYWLYGVINDKSIEEREELKDTKEAIKVLINVGLIKEEDSDFSKEVEDVLIAALKSDIAWILKKKQK